MFGFTTMEKYMYKELENVVITVHLTFNVTTIWSCKVDNISWSLLLLKKTSTVFSSCCLLIWSSIINLSWRSCNSSNNPSLTSVPFYNKNRKCYSYIKWKFHILLIWLQFNKMFILPDNWYLKTIEDNVTNTLSNITMTSTSLSLWQGVTNSVHFIWVV